jgi:hypothetical protein
LAAAGVLALLAAAIVLAVLPIVFGRPRPMVHVQWRGIDSTGRAALERQFELGEARDVGGGRWAYVPRDTGRDRLEALVSHPAVADTDGIDRHLFRIARRAPLTERRGGLIASPLAARAAKLAAYALIGLGLGLLLAAALSFGSAAGWSWREVAVAMPGVLERGVPVASPQAAGLFRIVFGGLVLIYLACNPVYPALLEPYEIGRAAGAYGGLMRWLAEHPAIVERIDPALKSLGALVVAGAATSVAYPAFVAAFLLWACVYTLNMSHHVVAAIGVALVCLLPARWGDAWSIDAWWRGRPGALASKRYGFAMWVPVVVAGAAFSAAAASKLGHGADWILNGSVKYHFVSDLEHAWVTWGPWLMRHDAVAIPISAAVVVLEAVIVTAAFTRSDGYRLAIGLVAALLLAGFAVFQGVVWPGWWILLVGFLPWHRVRGAVEAGRAAPLALAQRAAVSTFVVFQLYASSVRMEARPIVSAFDMYASTYADDEEYELASNLRYRVFAILPGGAAAELECTIDDQAAEVLSAAGRGAPDARTRMRRVVAGCLDGRRDVEYVKLEGERPIFDWNTNQFTWKRGLDPIGPVPVGWVWQ